jgi:Asp-tRNA(Asn)/Glu-tRNA(Gln) amidotransferase A subunit family amidase
MKNFTMIVLTLALLGGCSKEPAAVPMSSSKFTVVEATINDIQAALAAGQVSCREVVQAYLDRIARYDKPRGINAIILINPNALSRADEVDVALANDAVLPDLFCAPIVVKDNFDTFDMPTSGGSIALKDSIPPDDAFMVRKLREAGAIVLAKSNMAEWAFSPRETISSSYGRTANAYDADYVPAGSSGGTASAVAASMAVAGLGSDTGNSIRGPSSHLALFGIRSTLGLTSRDGVIPLSFDRDIAGPMARTVEDGVRLFNVVADYDSTDSLAVPAKREADYRIFLRPDGVRGKRIGVLRALVDHPDADPEITALFLAAIEDMTAAGAIIVDPFEISQFTELTENMKFCRSFRYDIGKYLLSLENPPISDVNEVLASGQYGADAKRALEFFADYPMDKAPDKWEQPCLLWPKNVQRNLLLANTIEAMDRHNVDVLVYPSWSNPPAHIDKARAEYKGDNSQTLAPAAGLPAMTVPMGFWQDRLPAGLQLLGRPYSEGVLIELAFGYEQATGHRRGPDGLE